MTGPRKKDKKKRDRCRSDNNGQSSNYALEDTCLLAARKYVEKSMCIFVFETRVDQTHIFVAPIVAVQAGRRMQLTVYQNSIVNAEKKNAMILPVPDPDSRGSAGICLYDMSGPNSRDFFGALDRFYAPVSIDFWDDASPSLRVERIGNYDVSIAANVDELVNRLDAKVFGQPVDPALGRVFSTVYAERFCFLVCMFAADDAVRQRHPIAYMHDALDTLFVPTLHIHDGASMPPSTTMNTVVYSMHTQARGIADSNLLASQTWTVESFCGLIEEQPFDFAPRKKVAADILRRHEYKGIIKNEDVYLRVAASVI